MLAVHDSSTLTSLQQLLDAALVLLVELRLAAYWQRVSRVLSRCHTLVHVLEAASQVIVLWLRRVQGAAYLSEISRPVHAVIVELDQRLLIRHLLVVFTVRGLAVILLLHRHA